MSVYSRWRGAQPLCTRRAWGCRATERSSSKACRPRTHRPFARPGMWERKGRKVLLVYRIQPDQGVGEA